MDIQKIKWFLWNLAKEYIPNRSFLKKIKKEFSLLDSERRMLVWNGSIC